MPSLAGIEVDQVEILRAQPGDAVFIKTKTRLSHQSRANLEQALMSILPQGVKVGVLEYGEEIVVVRQEKPCDFCHGRGRSDTYKDGALTGIDCTFCKGTGIKL